MFYILHMKILDIKILHLHIINIPLHLCHMICMIDKLTVSDLTTNFVTLPKLPETEH